MRGGETVDYQKNETKNNNRMSTQEANAKLENLLFEFVERSVKKGATPEEIAALPEVASVLMNIRRT